MYFFFLNAWIDTGKHKISFEWKNYLTFLLRFTLRSYLFPMSYLYVLINEILFFWWLEHTKWQEKQWISLFFSSLLLKSRNECREKEQQQQIQFVYLFCYFSHDRNMWNVHHTRWTAAQFRVEGSTAMIWRPPADSNMKTNTPLMFIQWAGLHTWYF